MVQIIQHRSIEEWRNGARIDVFTIQHAAKAADGTPVLIDDPTFVPQPLEPGDVAGPVPQVPKVENVTYSMPEKPNAGFALVYLKAARTWGADVALAWLLELAIGEEAYDALAAEPDLEADTFNAIMLAVQTRALGVLAGPKG